IISSATVAAIGNGAAFAKGRDFGAWLGLVPKQISTGDRTILGKISRRGNLVGSIGSYCGQGICDLLPGAPETHGISGMALKRPSAPPPQGPLARNSFAEPHLDFRIEHSIDRTTRRRLRFLRFGERRRL